MTHIPGHIGTTDGGGGGNTLPVGSLIRDAQGNIWEVTSPVAAKLVSGDVSGARFRRFDAIIRAVGRFFVTETGRAIEINADGTFRQLTAGETNTLFPAGGGGGGGAGGAGAPAFGSTQAGAQFDVDAAKAAAAQAAKVAADAAEALRIFNEEQAELDRLRADRQSRLNIARDVIAEKEASARGARAQGTELAGQDIFRFLAVARGLQPPTGTTPAAGFKQNLLGAAQFQAPDLEQFTGGETAGQLGVDINALTSVISKLQGTPDLPTTDPFSFAHGGTVSAAGIGGPNGSKAIRVGEAGPEILILRPDGSVEVVPEAGSAQEGGVFDFGGLAPLFQRLRGAVGVDPGTNLLGSTGTRLNELRSIFGFLPSGQEQETDAPFQAFAGPVLRIQQGQQEALQNQFLQAGLTPHQARIQSTSEAKRVSALIGLLPAPFKIPPAFFGALLPAEQNALVSAYRFAGVPEADFRHLLTVTQLPANPVRATAVG